MGLGNATSLQLLQFLYKDLDDQLQQASRPSARSTAPETEDPLCAAGGTDSDDKQDHHPVSDKDSDEDLEEWDEREFLQFEVRFGQLTAATDVKAAPELETAAKSQLEYFEDRIQGQPSPPSPESDNRFILERRDSTVSAGWEDLGGAQEYVERAIQDGGLDGQPPGNFVPSTLQEWRSTVNRFTGLNRLIERLHLQESCDASCPSKPPAPDQPRADEAFEALYSALVDQHTACLTRARMRHGIPSHNHAALLQLAGFHESPSTVLRLLLSACSDTDSKPDRPAWHETWCKFESYGPTSPHQQLVVTDLCQEIRICKAHRIPLNLSYTHKGLWCIPKPPGRRTASLQTFDQISLASLLGGGVLDDESLDVRLKKSRLALQLATAVQKLYPGPWLQDGWSSTLIRFVYDKHSDRVDRLDQPYIPCMISDHWKTSNKTSGNSEPIAETCPPFFLSFAQLLIDIAKGGRKSQHHKTEDPIAWYGSLLEELNSSFHDEIFRWYGKAIQGCLQYSIDFSLESTRIQEPRRRAQTIIRENIVHHLERNLGIWERKWQQDVTVQTRSLKLKSKDHHTYDKKHDPRPPTPQSPKRLPRRTHSSSSSDPNNDVASRITEPAQFTLFADGDEIYEKRSTNGQCLGNAFIKRMEAHKLRYIAPLPRPKASSEEATRNVRIAVLDTGLRVDDSDMLLCGGEHRVKRRRNFIDPRDSECADEHGHGTHVTRLLLRFAPRADIIIAKIAEGRSLQETKLTQLIQALRWAGENADIINLSFGLGALSIHAVGQEIKALVKRGKLIFAAASNSGGNGPRAYPARETGVFCIHATDDRGDKARGMNPARLDRPWDNFSTLGVKIDSYWNGQEVFISGTSFATPVAAAIAANSLEFIQHRLNKEGDMPQFFRRYAGMRLLFHEMADYIDGYDYVRPWKEGLWDSDDANHDDGTEGICERLREIYTTRLMSTSTSR